MSGRPPARLYSWPPFTAGHELSLKHGAHSPGKLRPIVDELLVGLAEVAPWSSVPAFRPVVEAWAFAEAKAISYRRWFDERGLEDDKGQPLAGLEQWDRAERRAANLRVELGLTPSSLARLMATYAGVDQEASAVGAAAVAAVGAGLRAKRALGPGVEQGLDGVDAPGGDGEESVVAGEPVAAEVSAAGAGGEVLVDGVPGCPVGEVETEVEVVREPHLEPGESVAAGAGQVVDDLGVGGGLASVHCPDYLQGEVEVGGVEFHGASVAPCSPPALRLVDGGES